MKFDTRDDGAEFLDHLAEVAEQHPDENDPYWDQFWRLKSSSDLDRERGGTQ